MKRYIWTPQVLIDNLKKARGGNADPGDIHCNGHLSCSMGVGKQNISGKEPKQ